MNSVTNDRLGNPLEVGDWVATPSDYRPKMDRLAIRQIKRFGQRMLVFEGYFPPRYPHSCIKVKGP